MAFVVVPSGDTRLATTSLGLTSTGAVPPVGTGFNVPLSPTAVAGYHLPSLVFTKRLPLSSVYTTVPASPLRNAFTLVVKSLPFKPSLPVKPWSPAVVPEPSAVLPSRPSATVLPILPRLFNLSFTS